MTHNLLDEAIARRAPGRNELGKWGRMHLNFLEASAPALLDKMEKAETLWPYLKELNDRLTNKYLDLLETARTAEGVFEDNFPDWQSFHLRFNTVQQKAQTVLQEEYVFVLPKSWDDDDLPF